MLRLASFLGLTTASRHACRAKQHEACAVQGLCGVAGWGGHGTHWRRHRQEAVLARVSRV